MATSSFEKLLEVDFDCKNYLESSIDEKAVSWTTAKSEAESYRTYLSGLSIPDAHKVKAYVITQAELKRILSQSNGDLDAIRIYIGRENVVGGFVVKLFAVGCKSDPATGKYDDYMLGNSVPLDDKGEEDRATLPLLSEVRPCPDNCAKPNFMNS